jgi:hypothetical protein
MLEATTQMRQVSHKFYFISFIAPLFQSKGLGCCITFYVSLFFDECMSTPKVGAACWIIGESLTAPKIRKGAFLPADGRLHWQKYYCLPNKLLFDGGICIRQHL